MTHTQLSLLQQMPIFGGITDEMLEFLLQRTRTEQCAAGDFFFREGDKAEELFVLERGKVEILRHWQGREYCISTMGPGDCFGEMALIDFCPRSASVRALEDCSAIELSATDLQELYGKDPAQFTMIYMNLGRELSRRLRDVNDLLFKAGLQSQKAQ
ncbi:cyclic nucleotide-binding protein [Marinobacterium aestuarii]|uniref:Cyclic nucleotide-binding protein n=1 Tax=Marinobacterium aestuarii TaxID=1821621 RepID=A0A1A9F079_9GAMM|nr:cyclic nucleotide-binding domain-containing protein [Marinobacterium aestuarii]ANG63596.1 cyclic nucleotide-binding protein [Marinobacterium aestuarii]